MSFKQSIDKQKYNTLIEQDFDFKKMADEHEKCETKINAIAKQKFVSAKEEMEVKSLQKLKLSLRDKMMTKMAQKAN